MNFLFIHQGFPGQYVHIIEELVKNDRNFIVALGLNDFKSEKKNLKYIKYGINKGNAEGIHPWVVDIESKVIRGEACAEAAELLKGKGFRPNIICGHPGWGELLFIKKIWPDIPILQYQEFFYQETGSDSDFDPEFREELSWKDTSRTMLKQVNSRMNLDNSTWNITPTNFQKNTFPKEYHNKISVIHDGVDTSKAIPDKRRNTIKMPEGAIIDKNCTVITFINRRLEPYRGCHTFIRAIPRIQELINDCQIIIIGATSGVSYGAVCKEGEWKDVFLNEIKGRFDNKRVHFVGSVNYETYIQLMKRTNAHIYLTYPFVLSWSMLEAMSCAAPVIGSSTAPVTEVIEDKINGLLTNFFDSEELAQNIALVCKDKILANRLGKAARETILKNYELNKCLNKQIDLINMVANKTIG